MTKDNSLLEACKALWDNIVEKRMYLIGGIGSSGHLERFTTDYDLPNDSGYAETCAAIGLAQFGIRMARITGDASYIDIVERALYNNIRAGIALSGDRYFYVNPMEVWPSICMPNTSRAHVKPTRQRWFDVACCPTNIARTMSSLGQFIYETGNDALVVNLFIANEAEIPVAGGNAKIKLICDYPKSGLIRLQIDGNSCEEFELSLRLPGFAHNHKLFLNGKQISSTPDHGYFRIRRKWKSDSIELFFEIEPVWVCSNVHVRDNIGKLAILRGPEVYCLEEIDNGKELSRVFISPDTDLKEDWDPALMGGTMKLNFTGNLLNKMDNNRLPQFITKKFTAVPYGSWNNRGDGEMVVWLRALWHSKRNKKDTKA